MPIILLMTKRRLHSWAALFRSDGWFLLLHGDARGGRHDLRAESNRLIFTFSMFCHSSIYFCGFVTIGTEVCSAKDAPKLTLGVAWVAVRAALPGRSSRTRAGC